MISDVRFNIELLNEYNVVVLTMYCSSDVWPLLVLSVRLFVPLLWLIPILVNSHISNNGYTSLRCRLFYSVPSVFQFYVIFLPTIFLPSLVVLGKTYIVCPLRQVVLGKTYIVCPLSRGSSANKTTFVTDKSCLNSESGLITRPLQTKVRCFEPKIDGLDFTGTGLYIRVVVV